MIKARNILLVLFALGISGCLLPMMALIFRYMLPLSASEALHKGPNGAHELGFWLLLLVSLPIWLVALWLSTLAIISGRKERKLHRRLIWGAALIFMVLALAAIRNTFGFGDVFIPPGVQT